MKYKKTFLFGTFVGIMLSAAVAWLIISSLQGVNDIKVVLDPEWLKLEVVEKSKFQPDTLVSDTAYLNINREIAWLNQIFLDFSGVKIDTVYKIVSEVPVLFSYSLDSGIMGYGFIEIDSLRRPSRANFYNIFHTELETRFLPSFFLKYEQKDSFTFVYSSFHDSIVVFEKN